MDRRLTRRSSGLHRSAYAAPFVLMAVISAIYAVSPGFYLRYVLLEESREFQAVEILTFASAALASILLFYAAWRLWRSGTRVLPTGGVLIIAVVGLAALFFAGEEVDWGGTFSPDYRPHRAGQQVRNLHNRDLLPFSVQSAGSAFIVAVFFVLPAVWSIRDRTPLPRSWRPAVAEGPVICTMALAFIWKLGKEGYKLIARPDTDEPGIYNDFIEQFNEHKEMLIAIGLLMYGVYRVRAVHRAAKEGGEVRAGKR